MYADIDQAWYNVEAGYIERLIRLSVWNIFRDAGDLAVFDFDIDYPVHVILHVDDMAALTEKIITGLRSGGSCRNQRYRERNGNRQGSPRQHSKHSHSRDE
jgi:hypothetical protein